MIAGVKLIEGNYFSSSELRFLRLSTLGSYVVSCLFFSQPNFRIRSLLLFQSAMILDRLSYFEVMEEDQKETLSKELQSVKLKTYQKLRYLVYRWIERQCPGYHESEGLIIGRMRFGLQEFDLDEVLNQVLYFDVLTTSNSRILNRLYKYGSSGIPQRLAKRLYRGEGSDYDSVFPDFIEILSHGHSLCEIFDSVLSNYITFKLKVLMDIMSVNTERMYAEIQEIRDFFDDESEIASDLRELAALHRLFQSDKILNSSKMLERVLEFRWRTQISSSPIVSAGREISG